MSVAARFADPQVPVYIAQVVRRGLLGDVAGQDFGFFELAGLYGADPGMVMVESQEQAFDLIGHVLKVIETMQSPDEVMRVNVEELG